MHKKSILAALVLLILLTDVGFCQEISKSIGKLSFGLKGGVNIASCSGFEKFLDPVEWEGNYPTVDKGSRLGAIIGGFIAYRLTNNLSIQSEVMYSQEGCKRDFNVDIHIAEGGFEAFGEGKFETNENLDYLEIPILLKFAIGDGSSSAPFILVGPSLGINLGAEFDYEARTHYRVYENGVLIDEGDDFASGSEEVDEYVKDANFGLTFGGGYQIKLGTGALVIEARYVLGLIDVLEETGRIDVGYGEYIYLDEAKTRSISITVGYAFN